MPLVLNTTSQSMLYASLLALRTVSQVACRINVPEEIIATQILITYWDNEVNDIQ